MDLKQRHIFFTFINKNFIFFKSLWSCKPNNNLKLISVMNHCHSNKALHLKVWHIEKKSSKTYLSKFDCKIFLFSEQILPKEKFSKRFQHLLCNSPLEIWKRTYWLMQYKRLQALCESVDCWFSPAMDLKQRHFY